MPDSHTLLQTFRNEHRSTISLNYSLPLLNADLTRTSDTGLDTAGCDAMTVAACLGGPVIAGARTRSISSRSLSKSSPATGPDRPKLCAPVELILDPVLPSTWS